MYSPPPPSLSAAANTSDIDATLRLVFLSLGIGNDTSFTMQFRVRYYMGSNYTVVNIDSELKVEAE